MRLHPAFRLGQQSGVNFGVLALDDEVCCEEQVLSRELAAAVLLGRAGETIEKMLECDSQQLRSGDASRIGSGISRLGNPFWKSD